MLHVITPCMHAALLVFQGVEAHVWPTSYMPRQPHLALTCTFLWAYLLYVLSKFRVSNGFFKFKTDSRNPPSTRSRILLPQMNLSCWSSLLIDSFVFSCKEHYQTWKYLSWLSLAGSCSSSRSSCEVWLWALCDGVDTAAPVVTEVRVSKHKQLPKTQEKL